MDEKQIERILANTKRSMEVEDFEISSELENIGRKLLTGELKMEDYLETWREKARSFAYEA